MSIPSFFIIIPSLVHHYSIISPSFSIISPSLFHHYSIISHHHSIISPSFSIISPSLLHDYSIISTNFPSLFHDHSIIFHHYSIIFHFGWHEIPHFPKGSSCQLPGHAWSAPFRGYLCSLHGLRGSRTTGLAGDLEMLMFYGVLWCFMVCKPPYRMAKHGEHMRKSCSNHGEFHGFVVGKTMP